MRVVGSSPTGPTSLFCCKCDEGFAVATCDCPNCDKQGATSRSNLTDCIYCNKCAKRVNILFMGLIKIEVRKDEGSKLLGSLIGDCVLAILDED